jgi:HAD superfamily hydrolase (TIGR01509 family)
MTGMNRPQVVVFDLGKVLVDFDYGVATPRIAARGNVSPDAVKRLLNESPLLFRYETGLITTDEFFEEVRAATAFRGDMKEFRELFGDIFTPITPMIELHSALRKRSIPTYIFSNTNELQIGHIRRNFPFMKDFDGYILSFEHGAMKPAAKIYEVVERETNRRREEILYVDDRPENVAAGAARGWQVILQETPEKTRAAFEKSGLLDQTWPGGVNGPPFSGPSKA